MVPYIRHACLWLGRLLSDSCGDLAIDRNHWHLLCNRSWTWPAPALPCAHRDRRVHEDFLRLQWNAAHLYLHNHLPFFCNTFASSSAVPKLAPLPSSSWLSRDRGVLRIRSWHGFHAYLLLHTGIGPYRPTLVGVSDLRLLRIWSGYTQFMGPPT